MASGPARCDPCGARITRWLRMWHWRSTETLSARLPRRFHERLCPFCRGWNKYVSKGAR